MKRDINLVRDLLLFYESDCTTAHPAADPDAVDQHLIMLIEAGFISGKISDGCFESARSFSPLDGRTVDNNGVKYMMFPLTWEGHDFLAAARDNKVWNTAIVAVGSMTFEIIKEYLQTLLRRSIGLEQ